MLLLSHCRGLGWVHTLRISAQVGVGPRATGGTTVLVPARGDEEVTPSRLNHCCAGPSAACAGGRRLLQLVLRISSLQAAAACQLWSAAPCSGTCCALSLDPFTDAQQPSAGWAQQPLNPQPASTPTCLCTMPRLPPASRGAIDSPHPHPASSPAALLLPC